jgi:hypothetical protein
VPDEEEHELDRDCDRAERARFGEDTAECTVWSISEATPDMESRRRLQARRATSISCDDAPVELGAWPSFVTSSTGADALAWTGVRTFEALGWRDGLVVFEGPGDVRGGYVLKRVDVAVDELS